MNEVNPIIYGDKVYEQLKSVSDNRIEFNMLAGAVRSALFKAEEEVAEARRAAAVNTIEEALRSFFEADGEVTCYVQDCHETFHSFDSLIESMEFHEVGFNDGEEVY